MAIVMPSTLSGPRGLIVAIIAHAARDALNASTPSRDKRSAINYFQSDEYQHHLQLLELPPEWMPEGVDLEKPR